jgi:hypothetical protein
MTLDASGNLVLGQTSAQAGAKLSVKGGSVRVFNGQPATVEYAMGPAGASGDYAYLSWNNTVGSQELKLYGDAGFISFYANAAERARIDSSGNLLVGTTNTGLGLLNVGGTISTALSSGGTFALSYTTANASSRSWRIANDVIAYGDFAIQQSTTQTGATFASKLLIDSSGNLLVGTTSNSAYTGKAVFSSSSQTNIVATTSGAAWGFINNQDNAGTQYFARFDYANTQIGSIQGNNTVTTYNTTSDYRLKNVIGAVTGHGERLDALEPVEYEWKSDGSRTRGFLAHKFQEVYAGSVTGSKDEVNAEGKPVYQAMQASSSEVIADLVAEIKSLRKRLADAGL